MASRPVLPFGACPSFLFRANPNNEPTMAYMLGFFVGHFFHDGNFASTKIDDTTKLGKPVVQAPLDGDEMRQLAVDFCNGDAERIGEWDIRFANGLIIFCEFRDTKALAWVQ